MSEDPGPSTNDSIPFSDAQLESFAKGQALHAAAVQWLQMSEVLKSDYLRCLENLDPSDHGWRRILYRTSFAWIEGDVHAMKHLALQADSLWGPRLSQPERILLEGRDFRLSEQGKAREGTFFARSIADLRFAFRSLAKAIDADFQLDTDGQGFEEYRYAKEVRDRLTHPKLAEELIVTDQEMLSLSKTVEWFSQQKRKIAEMVTGTVQYEAQRVREDSKKTLSALTNHGVSTFRLIAQVRDDLTFLADLETAEAATVDPQKIASVRKTLERWQSHLLESLPTPPPKGDST